MENFRFSLSYAYRKRQAVDEQRDHFLSAEGMGEALILQGAANRVAFEVYVERVLGPSLKPGHIVLMDTLQVHKGERVRRAIEARGYQLLFLPAYSPDFSPIEEAFSKHKAFLRKIGARTREALEEALVQAFAPIATELPRGGFDAVATASRQIEPISRSLLEQALASMQAPVTLAVRIVSRQCYTKVVVEELHICTVFFCRPVSSVKVSL